MIIHSGAVDKIVADLNDTGAFIGPKAEGTITDDNSFEIWSKHFLQFPKELNDLQKIFKCVELLDRSRFRIHMHSGQKMNTIPTLLQFTAPSEIDSVCLSTEAGSPWTQLRYGGKIVLLNNDYTETIPEILNTIYIKGFHEIYNAAYIEDMLKGHTPQSHKIVDELESTGDRALTARFLKNDNRDKSNQLNSYVLALSTTHTEALQQLRESLETHTKERSNYKFSVITTGLQKLQLAAEITSTETELLEIRQYSSKNERGKEGEHACSQNEQTEQKQDFTPVAQKNNKNKQQKNVSNEKPPEESEEDEKSANNKYSTLLLSDEEEEEEQKETARRVDTGDFGATEDTVMKKWLVDNICNNENITAPTNKQLAKLHKAIVNHVVDSSPDYHAAGKGVPTYFTQKIGTQKMYRDWNSLVRLPKRRGQQIQNCYLDFP